MDHVTAALTQLVKTFTYLINMPTTNRLYYQPLSYIVLFKTMDWARIAKRFWAQELRWMGRDKLRYNFARSLHLIEAVRFDSGRQYNNANVNMKLP